MRNKPLFIVIIAVFGAAVFLFSEFKSSTLVIHTRTLEKGTKFIVVDAKGSSSPLRVHFEIGSDEGGLSFYPIELPRAMLEAIRIPPLAAPGKYEIEKITLSNGSSVYSWDHDMVCSHQLDNKKLIPREACNSDAPTVSIDHDSSIVISALPASGSENALGFRASAAFISMCGLFLCIKYLLIPTNKTGDPGMSLLYASRAAWLCVGVLFVYQLFLIVRYSVDIPNYEEWEFFESFALPNGISWEWLTRPVSHQRSMFFTKLMSWINLKMFHLDFVKLKIFNYALFACLLLMIKQFKDKAVGRDKFVMFPLFMLFLLSPIVYEVHAASFQSGELFVLLFAFGMINSAFNCELSYTSTVTFTLCALLAMYSLSAGLVLTIICFVSKIAFGYVRIKKGNISSKKWFYHILASLALILPGIIWWVSGFKAPEYNPQWLYPNNLKFWTSFLNLLSFGFGFEIEHSLPGILCLLVLLFPLVLLLKGRSTRWEPATWQIVTAIFCVLAVVGLITIGRGNMDGSIKVSRYAVFSILSIPCASIAWWMALDSQRKRCVMMTLIWGGCAMAYWNNWNYDVYRDISQLDILNLECVQRYNDGNGDGNCPGTHFRPIGAYFENAKKLGVSFTRQF